MTDRRTCQGGGEWGPTGSRSESWTYICLRAIDNIEQLVPDPDEQSPDLSRHLQGGVGQQAAGPQLLASVVPRPGQAAAMANLGLPGVGIPSSSGDSTAYFQQLLQGQQPASPAMLPSGVCAKLAMPTSCL